MNEIPIFEQYKQIASIHIPKTAGSSMRDWYANTLGIENIARYSIKTRRLHPMAQGLGIYRHNPAIYALRDILSSTKIGSYILGAIIKRDSEKSRTVRTCDSYKVIHGHFSPLYAREQLPDAAIVTVLREPLERALSGYFFIKRIAQSAKKYGLLPDWYLDSMSFQDFTEVDEMIDFQTKFLCHLDPKKFALVGITEKLDLFCQRLNGNNGAILKNLNSTQRPKIDLTASFLKSFRKRNSEDYAAYEWAASQYI